MLSLFLHRISVACVYLSIAATTQDPAGWDPHHQVPESKSSLSFYGPVTCICSCMLVCSHVLSLSQPCKPSSHLGPGHLADSKHRLQACAWVWQWSTSQSTVGSRDYQVGQGQRLTCTKIWHGTDVVHTGLPSGLDENKAGFLPQWDRAEPCSVPCVCSSLNKSYQHTSSSHVCSLKCFSRNTMRTPFSLATSTLGS